MVPFTTLFGGLLILLGVISFFVTGGESITALIPSFFGFGIGTIGAWARNKQTLRKPLGIATFLAFIGFIATLDGIFDLYADITTGQAISKALMAVFCFIYLVVSGVWYFSGKGKSDSN